ncbi:hypothetical protein F5Y07DRAFT_380485 [Xylaria sp. FL0933]|nr:hypothetical protein F5Y07DRAFT_380485 [Xylaria sp. FL0933]
MVLPEPPAGLDLTASQVAPIYAGLLIPWVFAILNVVLRFTARRITKNGVIVTEDWLVLVALATSTIQVFTTLFYSIPHGLGRHIWVAPADATKAWALGLFIAEITYTLTMTLVKYSTLIFYWRMFSTKRSIRLPILLLTGVTTLWGIAIILVTSLQCLPTSATWERYDPVHPLPQAEFTCPINVSNFVLGNAVPNIITDGLIVLLPIPYVLSLQLRRSQKIALACAFLLGLLVTLTSILRLVFFQRVPYTNPDVTWAFTTPIIWSNVECNLAIAVSSLPFLRPILSLVLHGKVSDPVPSNKATIPGRNILSNPSLGRQRNNVHSLSSNMQTSVTARREEKRPFTRLYDRDSPRRGGEGPIELGDFDNSKIVVTKEFQILHRDEEWNAGEH